MCNLYTVRKSTAEIAADFGVVEVPAVEVPIETTPRTPGLIVREQNGRHVLQALSWGFPRLSREARLKREEPSPVNLVANLTSPMWDQLVVDPRYCCLIPMTHFAEPAGEPGSKTRTWFSVANEPLFAWAGFCRNTPEWGPVFAGMTTDSNAAVMPFNERMPVLLAPSEYEHWLRAPIQDVIGFQFRPFLAERLTVLETTDRWRSGRVPGLPSAPDRQMALL
jgi:putative SOS response-associated peptidase YedK